MVEWGEALEEMAQKPGLCTNKALAKEVSMSAAWVGVRRRLVNVKLPSKVREAFIGGVVPLDGEPLLRKVAAVSPRIAECLREVFEKGDPEAGDFVRVREFDLLLLYDVADNKSLDDPPTMLDPNQIRLSEDRREELAARLRAASGSRSTTHSDPCIRLGEDNIAGREDRSRSPRVRRQERLLSLEKQKKEGRKRLENLPLR